MKWSCALLLAPLISVAVAVSSAGNRLLVVNEESSEEKKYSQLFDDLKSRGYSVTFESPKSDKLALFRHWEREYDHMLLLPPKSKGLGSSLSPKILLDFINKDGNIMLVLAADGSIPSAVSSFLLEFDIALPSDKNTITVDHFNYDTVSAGEQHDVLLLPRPSTSNGRKNFFGGEGLVAFPRAVAQTLGNETPLLNSILPAKSTTYTYNPKDEKESSDDPFAVGSQIALVSAIQARNSARFTVFGSLEALEDKWFDASVKLPSGSKTRTANRDFAKQVTSWAFKETGVLKVQSVSHYLTEHTEIAQNKSVDAVKNLNPGIYRVKNDVTFNIEISEYENGQWSPFLVPHEDDLQLEFTMLSPYHRLNLEPKINTPYSTIFTTAFTTPDQHGIFAFKVNYKRPFFTNLEFKEEVTVRHFAHDEFPRSWSISGAWPWIGGIWVTIGGWLVFIAVWLWSAPSQTKVTLKKIQ